jgi:ABC-type branched-subunit amino acid transport system permease subunit
MILLGATLVIFVLLVPNGLIGLFQRWRRKGG